MTLLIMKLAGGLSRHTQRQPDFCVLCTNIQCMYLQTFMVTNT